VPSCSCSMRRRTDRAAQHAVTRGQGTGTRRQRTAAESLFSGGASDGERMANKAGEHSRALLFMDADAFRAKVAYNYR